MTKIKDSKRKRTARQIQGDMFVYMSRDTADNSIRAEFENDNEYPVKSTMEFNVFIRERKLPGVSSISKYMTGIKHNMDTDPLSRDFSLADTTKTEMQYIICRRH